MNIYLYGSITSYLAIIKKGLIIDIACSKKEGFMLTRTRARAKSWTTISTKVRVQDLALYTHWPQHTKEFWDLLNEI